MATIMDSIAESLRETIASGIEFSGKKISPTTQSILASSMGVMPVSGLGRGWLHKKLFCDTLSGGHQWAGPPTGGSVVWDGSPGGDLVGYSSTTTFDTVGVPVANVTQPGFGMRTLSLFKSKGSFVIPRLQERAEQLDPASVGSLIATVAKTTAMKLAYAEAHSLWALAGTGTDYHAGAVGRFTSAASSEDILTASAVPVTLTAGRIRAFAKGLQYDIFPTSGSNSKIANGPATVVNVDYSKNVLWLRTHSGSDMNLTASTSYNLVPTSARTDGSATMLCPFGWLDWMKESNGATSVYLYNSSSGIDLAKYAQYASRITTGINDVLSSDVLNRNVGRFADQADVSIDTLITTEGVLNALLQNVEEASQLVRYDIQGSPLNMVLGSGKPKFAWRGKLYDLVTDSMCPSGWLLGVKLGGKNIKRIVPPMAPRNGKHSAFQPGVEFTAPGIGWSSIFKPVMDNDAVCREATEAPFEYFMNFAPDEPQGFLLQDLAESELA